MTEALFSINNSGKLLSAIYYTITLETLERELLSDELIEEVIRRVIEKDCEGRNFIFNDLQVEILKKHEYKIEFFVSRGIPKISARINNQQYLNIFLEGSSGSSWRQIL